jgi:two-component system, cell cycle response regulator DivK
LTRLLFIDDDIMTLQLMSKIAGILGFQAILCSSAREGLQMAAQEKPALIFVDMQMGEMDGIEFVREARTQPELSKMPVLICSAGTGSNDEEKARQAGASGYLSKPLSLNKLLKTVENFSA